MPEIHSGDPVAAPGFIVGWPAAVGSSVVSWLAAPAITVRDTNGRMMTAIRCHALLRRPRDMDRYTCRAATPRAIANRPDAMMELVSRRKMPLI